MQCTTNITIVDQETPCDGLLEIDLLDHIGAYPKSSPPTSFDLVFYDYEDILLEDNELSISVDDPRPKEVNISIRVGYTKTFGGTDYVYVGLTIRFEDLCKESYCDENEYCDSCTGHCIEGEVDIDATIPVKGIVKLI